MSAQPVETDAPVRSDEDAGAELAAAPAPVEVRRNALVSAVIGAAASAIAIAYLWRAVGSGAVLDWVLCLAMGALATVFLRSLLDSRTPLLVVDEMGVRVRLGAQWRGMPWEAIDRVVVKPRKNLVQDGRLVVTLHHLQRAVEGLDSRASRHARLNQKMYGAALAVPLGLTTKVDGGAGEELADRVALLSQGRAEVVTLLDEPEPVTSGSTAASSHDDGEERPVISDDSPPESDKRPRWLRRSQEAATVEEEGDQGEVASTRLRIIDATTPTSSPRVRAIAELGDPVDPLVIGEFEPEPAYDPVIGPELAAARTRVGLSVDELADRTRIRPHVIESIEVDDFTPCGGDFYARGHIRTLARVLGKDPEPMLTHFEARYATAPINARRVFEAELATGMTGSMRRTVGGPNWALLVGVVLSLILVWSAVRLFAGDGNEVYETPPPILNGSAGLSSTYGQPRTATAPPPVPTTVTAVNAGATVEVLDGEGEVVFEGDLVIGEVVRVEVDPPITVSSDNGGAVSVRLGEHDMGFLGEPDQPVVEVFQRP
ncbi:MAG TPA: RodZ domain-containing protein [Marmoricola sp.]|nr:RodZ domain-containing protein [Marmoricola sp.]